MYNNEIIDRKVQKGKMYISTINNIFCLNFIIINSNVLCLSSSRCLEKRLRGTKLSSLENVPEQRIYF